MKKYRYIILILITLQIVACRDFLDIKPQGELTQEAFPETEGDALLATNAAYATLRSWHYHSGGFPILDIMSDDAHKGSNPNDALSTVGPYENFTHTTTQDGLDRWWTSLYEGIKRTNVVIEHVPQVNMDTNLRNRYIAEASFLRALYYFDLVRAWGGVPLVLTTNPDLKLPRSSAEEIFDQIERDLLFAASQLPGKHQYTSQDLGRATRGAAHALLARMYLYKRNYLKAEEHAMHVIQSSDHYDLEPIFENANGHLGEHGIESVFEIGAIGVEGVVGNQYANTQGVRGTPNRGWGFNRPSLDLRHAFDPDDPRLKLTIIDLGDVIDDVEILGDGTTPDITYDIDGNIIEVECYNRKVWIPGTNVASQFGHNRRLIRYADVLLMAAEALNENNKPDQALIYLNMVRARARQGNDEILPDITTTIKDELREIILAERRFELALEGHRFWDLVRTGKAAEILGPSGFEVGKHELFPIPQSEYDIAQGSLSQNPGW